MSGALEGRAGVITGGASGIGLALAEAFTAAGAEVAILDRSGAQDAAERVGGACVGIDGDVTDADGIAAAFGGVAQQLGRFDFLVNNAGIRHYRDFEDVPVELFRQTLDVNVTGTFICSQAAIRLMLERDGGAILNLASIAGRLALTRRAAYNASKAAVEGLTRSIAADFASRGIRCNAIAPGVIETPLSAEYFRDEKMTTILTEATPSARWGQVADIAGPAIFLCSDAAAHVHGETLFVDGGWNAAKGY